MTKRSKPVVGLMLALAGGTANAAPPPPPDHPFYLGADLSFANEMRDCGAVYRQGGKPIDPFVLVKRAGGNLVGCGSGTTPDGRAIRASPMSKRRSR